MPEFPLTARPHGLKRTADLPRRSRGPRFAARQEHRGYALCLPPAAYDGGRYPCHGPLRLPSSAGRHMLRSRSWNLGSRNDVETGVPGVRQHRIMDLETFLKPLQGFLLLPGQSVKHRDIARRNENLRNTRDQGLGLGQRGRTEPNRQHPSNVSGIARMGYLCPLQEGIPSDTAACSCSSKWSWTRLYSSEYRASVRLRHSPPPFGLRSLFGGIRCRATETKWHFDNDIIWRHGNCRTA